MLYKINLSSIDKCRDLVDICNAYRNDVGVDVSYTRYLVDACSFLGVLSLLNHTVALMINSSNKKELADFEAKIINIGAYRYEKD